MTSKKVRSAPPVKFAMMPVAFSRLMASMSGWWSAY
jgi:hypothetical protein